MADPDFSDPITISLTIEEISVMMLSYGMGIEHLMGKQAFMKMREAERPSDGIQMSTVYDSELQRSLAVYNRFQALAEEWRKNHPMNSNDDEEEPFSALVDRCMEEVSVVPFVEYEYAPEIGDKVQYVGQPCALIPGRLYTIENISKQDIGTYFVVSNGHYREKDFLTQPEFRPTYRVRYIGTNHHFDQGVGDERLFDIHDLQHWSGTPYLVIMTSDAQALSYPQVEFELLEDGVE